MFTMKNLIVISISLVFLTCGSNKNVTSNSLHKEMTSTNCPDDGLCTFEIFQNKTLSIKEDEIGALYPELSEGKKTIIKFEYKRDEIPNTADSNYSEIIYAEIDSNTKELVLKNELLNKGGMLIIEHSKHTDLSNQKNFSYKKSYGGNVFSFFEF